MDAFAGIFQHGRHGMLRQPVDLEVRMQEPQLARDRQVAAGMTETDRRGQIERTLCPAETARNACRKQPGARRKLFDEVADQQIDAGGIARLRQVPPAFDRDEPARRQTSATATPFS